MDCSGTTIGHVQVIDLSCQITSGPAGRKAVGSRSVDEHVNSYSLSVFPNPVSERVNFRMNAHDGVTISIYDRRGRLIKTEKHTPDQGLIEYSIDIGNWAPDLYIIKAISGQQVLTDKFIKIE